MLTTRMLLTRMRPCSGTGQESQSTSWARDLDGRELHSVVEIRAQNTNRPEADCHADVACEVWDVIACPLFLMAI